jgi:hypothetical protein
VKSEARKASKYVNIRRFTFDGVEVGDVKLGEPERIPVRRREGQRVRTVAEGRADGLVPIAPAAPGVDGMAGAEVEDGDDAGSQRS